MSKRFATRAARTVRSLGRSIASVVAVWWLADIMGVAGHELTDAGAAMLIGLSVPAFVLPVLLAVLTTPRQPVRIPFPPAPALPIPRSPRIKRRKRRRPPRILHPVPCSRCGSCSTPPEPIRRPPRIRTTPPPHRSLAALIAASTPGRPPQRPRRSPRVVRPH